MYSLSSGENLLIESRPCPDGQVFHLKNLKTPQWSTSKILNLPFGGDCFSFQTDVR